MLTRIFADNFRALANFEFRPQKLTLLVGENGSGKTSTFEVLALLSDIVVRARPVGPNFAFSRTAWDAREWQTFELDLVGPEDALYRYSLVVEHASKQGLSPRIKTERVVVNGAPLFEFFDGHVHLFGDDHTAGPVFPFRSEQSYLSNLLGTGTKIDWFLGFMAGVTILQLNPFDFGLAHQREDSFLQRYGSNFSAFWDYLGGEHPAVREQCAAQLREVLPGFQNFRLVRRGDEKQLVVDFSRGAEAPYTVGATTLSEGQRSLAVLYTALWGLVGRRSIVCFDEPDNFVGLAEIQPWLQSLRDQLEESQGGQAMIISHHPEVIDYLAADTAFRFERPAGNVVVRPLEVADPTSDFKVSELIARGG